MKLVVLDSRGKEIAVLVNSKMEAGEHTAVFNIADYSNLSNGVYIYNLKTDSFSKNGKMMLKR